MSSEQPALVEDVPVHGRGLGAIGPFQPRPFCDSMAREDGKHSHALPSFVKSHPISVSERNEKICLWVALFLFSMHEMQAKVFSYYLLTVG